MLKKSFFTIFAILIFLIVNIIDFFEIIPLQLKEKFEITSNSILFVTALMEFYATWDFSRTTPKNKIISIFLNAAIWILAFPMNIAVFRHWIGIKSFGRDVWCIHLGWIIWAAVQITVMSGFAKAALNRMCSFFKNIFSFFDIAEKENPYVFFIALLSFIIWVLYLGVQIYTNGIKGAFATFDIFWNSLLLWIIILSICFLLCILGTFVRKTHKEIDQASILIILNLILLIALATMIQIFPRKINALMVFTLLVLGFFDLKWIRKKGIVNPKNSRNFVRTIKIFNIRLKDLGVIIFSFLVFPSLLLLSIIALSPDCKEILDKQELWDINTWIDLVQVAADISKILLNLFKL